MIHGAQGLCFAVSSNTALFVISAFIRHGRVRRAHLGISAQTLPLPRRLALMAGAGARAVRIGELEAGGPAIAGGLREGDLIVALDGVPIGGADDLLRLLDADRIGRATEISLLREGEVLRRTVTPVERRR
jgi:S1-C subfamily serine protease